MNNLAARYRNNGYRLRASFERHGESWKAWKDYQTNQDLETRTLDINNSLVEGYRLWEDFHNQLKERNEQDLYLSKLSEAQRRSYQHLKEYFDSISNVGKNILDFLKDNIHPDISEISPGNHAENGLTYVSVMATLFWFEMDASISVKHEFSMSLVMQWRLEAERFAAAQSIASSCLASFQMTTEQPIHMFKMNNKETELEAMVTKDPEDYPYYLWDNEEEQTVCIQDFAEPPIYTCVSHTWGRWGILNEDGTPMSIELDGVPWNVPCNSRFDVQMLPSVLKSQQWATKYIWLDLLCIPQLDHDLPRKDKEISKQAAIFAFSSASIAWLNDVGGWDKISWAVAWLSLAYLRETSGLIYAGLDSFEEYINLSAVDGRNIFDKIYFPLKQKAPAESNSNELSDDTLDIAQSYHATYCCLKPAAECSTHLRVQKSFSVSGRVFDFAAVFGFPDWTTSLWTLQEACLCPKLSLSSSNFETLRTKSGQSLSLQDLIYLLHLIPTSDVPAPVRQLRICFPREFSNTTPMEVMLMANERQCTGARAPAIMSVLGFTDWYKNDIAVNGRATGSNSDLVLGRYPLSFVEEAARKIGSLFYATCSLNGLESRQGTMMPFCSRGDDYASFPFQVTGARKDCNCRGWRVATDGRVEIDKVVLVAASSNASFNIPILGSNTISIFGLPNCVGDTMQECLDGLCSGKDLYAFAIHLSQTTTTFVGVILLGISASEGERMLLNKVAAYQIHYDEDQILGLQSNGTWPTIPKVLAVDWIVF